MDKIIFEWRLVVIDEIGNDFPQQMLAPANRVFDKNSENAKLDNSGQSAEEKTTKTVIENDTLILEQYDRHGKLIRKTPPGYLKPGEKS
jgi:hypothetical protein